ncbi:MAG TPA: fumarylacetoacetate hydrolase family protein [Solirubrobacteraceae bacterium]|jgi:fumarylacetoacetate (FAA) hydrolase|nr:fumarylacetoacetate hydrolase family protein [Solirubrobacteraceae bacterium]
MRFVRYFSDLHQRAVVGRVVDEHVLALDPSLTLIGLLGDDGSALRAAGESAETAPHEVVTLSEANLLSVVERPPTVRDFYAFEGHVRAGRASRGLAMDPAWYQAPIFYFSNPYAVCGPGVVPVAPGSQAFDFELEIAAIIGRSGSDLTPGEGEASIAGYCVMNDFSARDLQRWEMALSLGPVKGKDTATALGPFFVTADELEPRRSRNGFELTMTARLNGTEISRASFADIYWSFGEMIAYATRGTWVHPGDVIGSGTCDTGCILELSRGGTDPTVPYLVPGDVVELAVDLLGTLRNEVAAGQPIIPLR